MLNFQNFVPKVSPPHRATLLCSNVVKFVRREIGDIVRYSHDKKKTKFWLFVKLSLLRGSRPKSTSASPRHLAHNLLNSIQIGSLSAELKPKA